MRAILTEHAEESTQGWTPERKEALRFAREVQDENGNVIAHLACYRQWTIVDGDTGEKFVELGIAVELVEVVATDETAGLLMHEVTE